MFNLGNISLKNCIPRVRVAGHSATSLADKLSRLISLGETFFVDERGTSPSTEQSTPLAGNNGRGPGVAGTICSFCRR